MITEKQVIDFLKMKDHQYIENLIQSLIVIKPTKDLDDSKKFVLDVDLSLLRKMEKMIMINKDTSVMIARNPSFLKQELCFIGLIKVLNNGRNSSTMNYQI